MTQLNNRVIANHKINFTTMLSRLLFLCVMTLLVTSCEKESPQPITPSTSNEGSISIVNDEFENKQIIIVGNSRRNFMVAFERTTADGTLLDFEVIQRQLPNVLLDNEGNTWNIEGLATDGPRRGERLVPVNSYIGFWFAWATMFPQVEIYNGPLPLDSFSPNSPEPNWTIPTDNVFTVLNQDGIPAIDNPQFETFDQREYIEAGTYFVAEDELVISVTHEGITKVYPHSILNWHEIVNDNIGDFTYSLSFCPITGTAVMWNRSIDGQPTTFGVSGLLYNGNVMPYDRETDSVWSQMRQESVTGELIGTQMEVYPVVETTWETCKFLYDEPLVLTRDTGFGKDYNTNPYESYITDNDWISYPVEYADSRLPNKERVLGIIVNGKAKVYQFKDF